MYNKLKEIFERPSQKRTSYDITTASSIIQSYVPIPNNHVRFLCFYATLHCTETVLSRQNEHKDAVYLIKGFIFQESKQQLQNTSDSYVPTILQPSRNPYFQEPGIRLTLQPDSIALVVKARAYENMQYILVTLGSSLEQEVDLLSHTQYFAKATRITCLTLLNNCTVRQFRKGEAISLLASNTPYFVRQGELEVVAYEDSNRKKFHELFTFSQYEIFGFFDLTKKYPNLTLKVLCRSAYMLVYCFDKTFFNTYIQMLSGDKLTLYKQRIEAYLSSRCQRLLRDSSSSRNKEDSKKQKTPPKQYSKDEDFILSRRSASLTQYLPQIAKRADANPVDSRPPTPPIEATYPQNLLSQAKKRNSSVVMANNTGFIRQQKSTKQLKTKGADFQDLEILQKRKKKCETFQTLCEKTQQTRGQILYEFFKNDWEATHLKLKQNLTKNRQ